MSHRIRGQEALIQVSVDNQLQVGSFFKVRDFRATPRQDLMEESYLGELTDDLDIQHHGWDLAWTVDNEDSRTLLFLSQIVAREALHLVHPDIVVTVSYLYREPGNINQSEVFSDVFMKVGEQSIGGRKDYVQTSFEAKAKERTLRPLI